MTTTPKQPTAKQQEALAWLRRENPPRTPERQCPRKRMPEVNVGAAAGNAADIYCGKEIFDNTSPNHNLDGI